MNLEEVLKNRSENKCELCGNDTDLAVYPVLPQDNATEENNLLACAVCSKQIDKKAELNPDHWKGLSEAMWSEIPAVQVIAWRILNRLSAATWAADLLDMMYLEEDRLAWAKATGDHESDGSVELHRDANGAILQTGDTVVLTKSLDVKGSTLNAKMGTVVKNIKVVEDNLEQIEGKIEGQVIVILTKYVRKQGA